jgi:hypothetical protein
VHESSIFKVWRGLERYGIIKRFVTSSASWPCPTLLAMAPIWVLCVCLECQGPCGVLTSGRVELACRPRRRRRCAACRIACQDPWGPMDPDASGISQAFRVFNFQVFCRMLSTRWFCGGNVCCRPDAMPSHSGTSRPPSRPSVFSVGWIKGVQQQNGISKASGRCPG